ncbi:hypothetical protein ACVOMV_05450 [Mesorhizobium atlanticum]
MNDDRLKPHERCASTSNRNFEGRQGFKAAPTLMSLGRTGGGRRDRRPLRRHPRLEVTAAASPERPGRDFRAFCIFSDLSANDLVKLLAPAGLVGGDDSEPAAARRRS